MTADRVSFGGNPEVIVYKASLELGLRSGLSKFNNPDVYLFFENTAR